MSAITITGRTPDDELVDVRVTDDNDWGTAPRAEFDLPNGQRITIAFDGDELYLNSGFGSVIIKPHSGNAIHIGVDR